MGIIKKEERIEEERYNKQGCLSKIIEYKDNKNIIIEFQDEYKARVKTEYKHFKEGAVKNPYFHSVCNYGMIGTKYPSTINGEITKEYQIWHSMICRCFDKKTKNKHPTYQDVTCCEEWLLFENFYEWLHSQENFDKWYNRENWNLDKDIIIKGNKIYNPEACCLVPKNVNILFTKCDRVRGRLPIGVRKHYNNFQSYCSDPFDNNKIKHLGTYKTIEEAFYAYKKRKEEIIKQIAQIEYAKGNISKKCYDAMMQYEVEITD